MAGGISSDDGDDNGDNDIDDDEWIDNKFSLLSLFWLLSSHGIGPGELGGDDGEREEEREREDGGRKDEGKRRGEWFNRIDEEEIERDGIDKGGITISWWQFIVLKKTIF